MVRKAYPSLKITPPTNPLMGSDQTFYAVEAACLNMDLFATIAKAAGKNLTESSFAHAGYALRNASIPGSGVPVSFAPGRAYPLGPVYPRHLRQGEERPAVRRLPGGEMTRTWSGVTRTGRSCPRPGQAT